MQRLLGWGGVILGGAFLLELGSALMLSDITLQDIVLLRKGRETTGSRALPDTTAP